MPCLLLPAQAGPGHSLELELLPHGTSPNDVLPQGQLYSSSLLGGAKLFWRHTAVQGWWGEQNELASSLSRLQVSGDAVLVLPHASSEAQLRHQLEQLAARHLRGSGWRLVGSWADAAGPAVLAAPAAAGSPSEPRQQQKRQRQDQQAMLHRLLRRPANAAPALTNAAEAAAGAGATVGAAAPATPPRRTSASSMQAGQGRQAGRGPPAVPHQQRQQAKHAKQDHQHDVRIFECEPRQQLLWSIAGRATSLSWQQQREPQSTATAAPLVPPGAASVTLPALPALAPTSPVTAPVVEAASQPVLLPPDSGPAACNSAAVVAAGVATPASTPASAAAASASTFVSPSVDVLPAKHRVSLAEHSPWAELQPEVLGMILAQAGHSSGVASAMAGVCRGWRLGLAEERSALQQLRFTHLQQQLNEANSNSSTSSGSSGSASVAGFKAHRRNAGLPWLVQQCVKAGNVPAAVSAARYLEQQLLLESADAASSSSAGHSWGQGAGTSTHDGLLPGRAGRGRGSSSTGGGGVTEIVRCWTRAAKQGHPEAQWKLGYWHYKGLMGVARDSEEALLWLTRAARQLAEVVGDVGRAQLGSRTTITTTTGSGNNGSGSGGGGGGGGAAEAGSAQVLPALMSHAGCKEILVQAAHILGYLFLDGEGTRPDTAAAIRWFRLAELHGCRDAGRVLGSLYNSGQFA